MEKHNMFLILISLVVLLTGLGLILNNTASIYLIGVSAPLFFFGTGILALKYDYLFLRFKFSKKPLNKIKIHFWGKVLIFMGVIISFGIGIVIFSQINNDAAYNAYMSLSPIAEWLFNTSK